MALSGRNRQRPTSVEQVAVDLRVARRNTGLWPTIQGLDAHATHQGRDMQPTDLEALALELLGKPPCPAERVLKVPLVDAAHKAKGFPPESDAAVLHAVPVQIEKFTLACDAQLRPLADHRRPLGPGKRPSAESKKIALDSQFADLIRLHWKVSRLVSCGSVAGAARRAAIHETAVLI
jgi:hypothetical protein